MTIPLFDVQCGFGSTPPGGREIFSAAMLLAEMDHVQIERALTRALPTALEVDVPVSNERLYAACAEQARLAPCPTVVPNGARDIAPEAAQVRVALRHGAGAVFIRPRTDNWSLAPWCCDRLFQALQQHRLPVICATAEVSYDDVATIAGRYPKLPCILTNVDYRQQRIVLPLLDAFPNVYLSIGSNYIVHGGIEQCATVVGAGRLLFGTGYPDVDMGAAIAHLLYADISDDEKALIGAGNLQRLIEEVVR